MLAVYLQAALWTMCSTLHYPDYLYQPSNSTKPALVGIAAYRSALTLDWMSAEDVRQRELASAFEQEKQYPSPISHTDCISYNRPSSNNVAKLMLELLRNLEGDNGLLVTQVAHALIRAKILLTEASIFENEPDLEALVETPTVMTGEPHATFPRVVAALWMAVTDPSTVKKYGWCTINKMTSFIRGNRPSHIAKHMRGIDQIVSRVRYIMEEFIQHVTPINMEKTHIGTSSAKAKARLRPQFQTPITRTHAQSPTPPQLVHSHLANRRSAQNDPEIYDDKIEDTRSTDKPTSLMTTSTETLATNQETEVPLEDDTAEVKLLENEIKEDEPPKYESVKPEMESRACRALLFFFLTCPTICLNSELDSETTRENSFTYRYKDSEDDGCLKIHPTARDIGKRFYAILPYFDRDHANTAFLHKYRGTVNQMSQGVDMLDREAAFYAAVVTPIIFLQHYRDTWCLLERFHRALRLYKISHPSEKRASLKLLQNLRPVNQKIRSFLLTLQGVNPRPRTTMPLDLDSEEFPDKNGIRYLKELVKNLG